MRRGRAPREAFSHCDCATHKSVPHCAKLRGSEMSCETAYGTDRWPSRAQHGKSVRRRRDTVLSRRRSAMRHAHATHRVRCAHEVDMSPGWRCRFLPALRGSSAAVDELPRSASASDRVRHCRRYRLLRAMTRIRSTCSVISARHWRGSSRLSSRPAYDSPRRAGAMARCKRTSYRCRPDR